MRQLLSQHEGGKKKGFGELRFPTLESHCYEVRWGRAPQPAWRCRSLVGAPRHTLS